MSPRQPEEIRPDLCSPGLLRALREAYAQPPRAYHNLEHVREVLTWYEVVARDTGWSQPDEVFLALLFHDAVYVAGAHDNEAESAALAETVVRRELPGASLDLPQVRHLIELTARHGEPGTFEGDVAHFLDADMAILGAAPHRFDLYVGQIREEYRAVPDELFWAGRARFVDRLLAQPRIYHSPTFFDRLEAQARANLTRARH